jgi:hypothetical protein
MTTEVALSSKNNQGLGKHLQRHFNKYKIEQDRNDGYLDATAMCAAAGRRFKMYIQQVTRTNSHTHANLAYLAERVTKVTLSKKVVVLAEKGQDDVYALIRVGGHRGKHSWVHPRVAIDLASWLSPAFHYAVCAWVARFLSGDRTLVQDVVERCDEVHGTVSMSTVSSVSKEQHQHDPEKLPAAHIQLAQYQSEVVILKAQLNTALTQQTKLQQSLEASEGARNHLSTAALQHEKQLDAAGAAMADLAALHEEKLDTKRAEVAELQKQLARMGVDVAAQCLHLDQQLADVSMKLSQTEDRKSILEKEVARKKRKVSDLTTQVLQSEHLLGQKDDQMSELRCSLQQCRLTVDRMRHGGGLLATQNTCLFQSLLQRQSDTGPSSSMPSRFVALKRLDFNSNGHDDPLVHALVKDTLAAIGENLNRFRKATAPTRAVLLEAVTAVVGQQCDDRPDRHGQPLVLSSNVCLTNFLCRTVKQVLGLKHATYCTAGQLYGYACRTNEWFASRGLGGEYQLVQELDLATALRLQQRVGHVVPRLNRVDIRRHFVVVGRLEYHSVCAD